MILSYLEKSQKLHESFCQSHDGNPVTCFDSPFLFIQSVLIGQYVSSGSVAGCDQFNALTCRVPSYLICFSFLDKELETLRGENRKNMLLSVALLVFSALFYYIFVYKEDESWYHPVFLKDPLKKKQKKKHLRTTLSWNKTRGLCTQGLNAWENLRCLLMQYQSCASRWHHCHILNFWWSYWVYPAERGNPPWLLRLRG